jgi:hypothetical protein
MIKKENKRYYKLIKKILESYHLDGEIYAELKLDRSNIWGLWNPAIEFCELSKADDVISRYLHN